MPDVNLETLEAEAAAVVEASAWSYVERGAGEVLDLFAGELRRAMAFCGATSVTEIGRDLLVTDVSPTGGAFGRPLP